MKYILLLSFSLFLSGCNDKFEYCPMPDRVSTNSLGDLMIQGKDKDVIKILKSYAEKGEASSQVALALILSKSNPEASFSWFQEAAKQNCVEGAAGLAMLYQEGIGVKKDLKLSFEWYLKLAKSGHKTYARHVSYLYANGEGVEKDEEKSYYWLEKADN